MNPISFSQSDDGHPIVALLLLLMSWPAGRDLLEGLLLRRAAGRCAAARSFWQRLAGPGEQTIAAFENREHWFCR